MDFHIFAGQVMSGRMLLAYHAFTGRNSARPGENMLLLPGTRCTLAQLYFRRRGLPSGDLATASGTTIVDAGTYLRFAV